MLLMMEKATTDSTETAASNASIPHSIQRQTAQALLSRCFDLASQGASLPTICRPPHGGKPYFQDSPWHFNLSHSGQFTLCGVDRQALGVDIQIPRPVSSALVERVCSPKEQHFLRLHPQAFPLLWVLKESYLKAQGQGIASGRHLATLDLPLPQPGIAQQSLTHHDWQFTLWQRPEVAFALCSRSTQPPSFEHL